MGEETFVFWGDFPKFLARVMLPLSSIALMFGCCVVAFKLSESEYSSDDPRCYRTFSDITVLVVDESGQTVEGATVRIKYHGVGKGQREAITDQNGRFEFRSVVNRSCNRYELRVRASGYQQYDADFALFSGTMRITLVPD